MSDKTPKLDALRAMREEAAKAAHRLMIEDGAPAELMRPPESPEDIEARRKRFARTHGPERKIKTPSGKSAPLALPKSLEPAGLALKKEIDKARDAKTKARFAALKARHPASPKSQEKPMISIKTNPVTIPKSFANATGAVVPVGAKPEDVTNISMSEMRGDDLRKASAVLAPKAPATSAPAPAKRSKKGAGKKTAAVKKPKLTGKWATRKPAKKTAAKAPAGDGPRSGSKLETIVGLLRRKGGCTTADILKATGWPSVSVPQQAKAAGIKLVKEKVGKVTRYSAA